MNSPKAVRSIAGQAVRALIINGYSILELHSSHSIVLTFGQAGLKARINNLE